tara:strand:- start:5088 stop:5942 length:855 start_codon:yes stop_codon:yes gene_type:complete
MKKLKFFYCLIAVSFLLGCGTDDSSDAENNLVADFSFSSDGSEFTFTNLSEGDITNYKWDFGDLYFYSNEKNPVYDYTIKGGELMVTLTVTNDQGQMAYATKPIVAPVVINANIIIDGNFDDWAEVPVAVEFPEANRSIKKMKFWTKGEAIRMYFEGTSAMELPVVDMFINTDESTETGFTDLWNVGADYLYEGPVFIPTWGSFYSYIGTNGAWGWAGITGADSNMKASGVIVIDGETNAVEISILKSYFGTIKDFIGFGLTVQYGAETYPDSPGSPIIIEIQK